MYRAVLEYWAARFRRGDTIYVEPAVQSVFDSEAAADTFIQRAGGPMMRGVPQTLLTAYARANTRPAQIRVPRQVKGRWVIRGVAPPSDRFKLRYVLSMSRPGFNAGGDSAMISASRTCGMLCGSGGTLLAVRGPRGWEVRRELSSVVY